MIEEKQIEEMAKDMPRYTKKDADGRYYIESVNGKLESNKFGHTYGEAIDRFAELENANVAPMADVAREIFDELELKAPFFCENQIAYEHFYEELAELKNKYTEDGK